jgi:uncharacterized membrane protein
MSRARAYLGLLAFWATMLATTASAAAHSYAGEGYYGETSDKTITYGMYIVIVFFPTIIVLLSVIQWRLDKRKHARMDAAKRRAASLDWRGGW